VYITYTGEAKLMYITYTEEAELMYITFSTKKFKIECMREKLM
jgi:hypothetical protein